MVLITAHIGYRSSDLGSSSTAAIEADKLNSEWMVETLKDNQWDGFQMLFLSVVCYTVHTT